MDDLTIKTIWMIAETGTIFVATLAVIYYLRRITWALERR